MEQEPKSPTQIIDSLYDSGELSTLVRSGFVSPSILEWIKHYKSYQSHKEKGINSTESAEMVSDTFNVSSRTVWRSIQKFK